LDEDSTYSTLEFIIVLKPTEIHNISVLTYEQTNRYRGVKI